MNENEKRLKQIDIENGIWVIYLVIIGLCFISNSYEKDYFTTNNINSRNIYRNFNIIIFLVVVIVYFYIFIESYKEYKDLTRFDSYNKRNFTTLSLYGTLFVLIGGLIFLYIAINDINIETEIAFN